MKVTGQQPPRTSELTSDKTREAEHKATRADRGAQENSPQVRSRTSLTMNKIKEVIRNTPDVRAQRVAELKEKVNSGKYEVDAERLAHNILTESIREDVEKP